MVKQTKHLANGVTYHFCISLVLYKNLTFYVSLYMDDLTMVWFPNLDRADASYEERPYTLLVSDLYTAQTLQSDSWGNTEPPFAVHECKRSY